MAESRVKALTDEEVVRFARISLTESAAATYTENGFDTQLSIERGVIWLIHAVDYQVPPGLPLYAVPASDTDTIRAQITRESQTSIQTIVDSDVIDFYQISIGRSAAIGTDAGPLTILTQFPVQHVFPIPIPFAAQQIYFGMVASLAIAASILIRVHYTIRSVSDAYFYRVAQALIG